MRIFTYLSRNTLKFNGLNVQIKRQSDRIKSQNPTICCLQETQFRVKDTKILKMMG